MNLRRTRNPSSTTPLGKLFSRERESGHAKKILLIFGVLLFISCAVSIYLRQAATAPPLVDADGAAEQAREQPETSQIRDQLEALPYITWHKADEGRMPSGVTRHDPSRSYKGVNFYRSTNRKDIFFMSMSGEILHTLKAPSQLLKPYQDDGFFFVGGWVGRVDWNSNVIWRRDLSAHHDIAADEDGNIYTITHERSYLPALSSEIPIDDNLLAILTKDGEVIKKISIAKMIMASKDRQVLQTFFEKQSKGYRAEDDPDQRGFDTLHTNTVEVINRDVFSEEGRLFEKGDVLISVRKTNTIAVVDVEDEKIVWSWGDGDVEGQHQPSLLDNGNILIFDNGIRRKYSRVIELNPITEEIEWEYTGNPLESFYSFSGGGAERLPNGNTLIAESNKGHIFEVTRNKSVVWEYWNPEIRDDERSGIYRFMRITDPEKYPGLRESM